MVTIVYNAFIEQSSARGANGRVHLGYCPGSYFDSDCSAFPLYLFTMLDDQLMLRSPLKSLAISGTEGMNTQIFEEQGLNTH